jgi:hypothetical protein
MTTDDRQKKFALSKEYKSQRSRQKQKQNPFTILVEVKASASHDGQGCYGGADEDQHKLAHIEISKCHSS